MGLKFKDKVSSGTPQPGDVAEREIQFDLKNRDIYSSSNGTDLIKFSCIPEETTHKGESLGTMGVTDDTAWGITLTTPSRLYANLTLPDDGDINHILAGTFDTNGFTLDVPAATMLTIV